MSRNGVETAGADGGDRVFRRHARVQRHKLRGHQTPGAVVRIEQQGTDFVWIVEARQNGFGARGQNVTEQVGSFVGRHFLDNADQVVGGDLPGQVRHFTVLEPLEDVG